MRVCFTGSIANTPVAIEVPQDAVGKLVSAELKVDEILYASRLVQPNYIARNGTSPLPITEDKVLFGVPALDFMSQLKFLEAGDQIDILFSLEFPEERNAAVKTDADADTQPATLLHAAKYHGGCGHWSDDG